MLTDWSGKLTVELWLPVASLGILLDIYRLTVVFARDSTVVVGLEYKVSMSICNNVGNSSCYIRYTNSVLKMYNCSGRRSGESVGGINTKNF